MNEAPAIPSVPTVRVPGFEIDLAHGHIRTAGGAHVELRPRSFAVLSLLAANAGHLVQKDEIMSKVWDDAIVTEDSLTQCIADIRRALRDEDRKIVRTVPRRGYLLALDVTPEASERSEVPDAVAGPRPQADAPVHPVEPGAASRYRRRWLAVGAAACVALLMAAAAFWPSYRRTPPELRGHVPDRPALAVLPFKSVAPSQAGDVLAAGLANEIINELARNKDVKVISRASSFALGGQGLSPAEIGARLRVRYLVDGTVQRYGDRLSIDVHLLDTRDGTVALGESFRGGAELIGKMEPAIGRKITGALLSGLRQKETDALLRRSPRDLDVYQLILQGIALTRQFNAQATLMGRRGLEEALRRDPDYGPAWATYCWLNLADLLNQFTGEWRREHLDDVIVQCNRAIELDPHFTRGYTGLSRAWVYKGNLDRGLRLMRQAVEIGPSDADNLLYLAWTLAQTGDLAESRQVMDEALEFSPIRPAYFQSHYSQVLWAAKRFDAVVEQTEACIGKAPKLPFCRIYNVLALLESGQREQAEAAYRNALVHVPDLEKRIPVVVPPSPELAARFRTGFALLGLRLPD